LISYYLEGRKGVGIEIDPNYVNLAIERLEKRIGLF